MYDYTTAAVVVVDVVVVVIVKPKVDIDGRYTLLRLTTTDEIM